MAIGRGSTCYLPLLHIILPRPDLSAGGHNKRKDGYEIYRKRISKIN